MESLLTSTAETLVLGFALLMAFDLFCGLLHLYRNSAPAQTEPQAESEQAITSQPEPKQKPQPQPLSLVTTGRDVVEPVSNKPATLGWLSTAINPDTLDTIEQPNVIEMARVRLPLVQAISSGQSERDLTRLGIRELKKRASAAKIKRYNVMTKTQLIDQLTALDQLTA